MQHDTTTHYLRSGNQQTYCGQPAQGLRAYHFMQRPEWCYFQHACPDCKAAATTKVFQQEDAPAKPASQALLDQFRHANTDRVVCALDALQQHSMAVALLYTSATTITAEVTSVKIKRNRKKETGLSATRIPPAFQRWDALVPVLILSTGTLPLVSTPSQRPL